MQTIISTHTQCEPGSNAALTNTTQELLPTFDSQHTVPIAVQG